MNKAKILKLIDDAIDGLDHRVVIAQAKNLETLVNLALSLEELELANFPAGGIEEDPIKALSVEELVLIAKGQCQ